MKIYEIDADVDNYISYKFLTENDYQVARKTVNKGKEIIKWNEVAIEPDPFNKCIVNSDYPGLLTLPLLSLNGKKVFEEYIHNVHFQFLNVVDKNSNISLYMLNLLTVIDALDRRKTKFEMFEDLIIGVEEYHFQTNITFPPIFKLILEDNRLVPISIFITDELKSLIEANGLKGFSYNEVWAN